MGQVVKVPRAPLRRPGSWVRIPDADLLHSSSHAVEPSHIQNGGRLAQMLAQQQSSSTKTGRLATDAISEPTILTKKTKWSNQGPPSWSCWKSQWVNTLTALRVALASPVFSTCYYCHSALLAWWPILPTVSSTWTTHWTVPIRTTICVVICSAYEDALTRKQAEPQKCLL